MSEWTTTEQSTAAWRDLVDDQRNLFHTDAWLSVLKTGLRARPLFSINHDGSKAAAVSVFRAGPFSVAFLGFPVGGLVGGDELTIEELQSLGKSVQSKGPVCLRLPVSAFSGAASWKLTHDATPESAILDLQSWTLQRIAKNRRRDVRKSQRSELQVSETKDPDDGRILFEQYNDTIARHRGSLRYTERYFRALIELSTEHPQLVILVAKLGNRVVGFTVVACHFETAYYLHGAFDWEYKELIPSAVLLNHSIEWAKNAGYKTFNLMSSPREQTSLVRYKEHWGAETREHRTYTLPTGFMYPVFRLAESVYRQIR